jgi:hypothetical protein
MRRLVTIAWVLAAALAAVPQDADAQVGAPERDGFFIGLGLGGGSFGCSDCGDRQSGLSGHLKLGGAVSSQLLLGVESSAWTKEDGGARLTHTNVSALAQFYPAPATGFFLRGGIGVSTLEASVASGGLSFSGRETGLGLTAGLGYDVRVGNGFSVSPYGTFGWGDFEGGSANTFQLGLGVTWH